MHGATVKKIPQPIVEETGICFHHEVTSVFFKHSAMAEVQKPSSLDCNVP